MKPFSSMSIYPATSQDEKNYETELEESDGYILIRMLDYCSEGPKASTQIMSYCNITRSQLLGYFRHCLKKELLRLVPPPGDDGLMYFETTELGKEVLRTAHDIMKALGIREPEQEK